MDGGRDPKLDHAVQRHGFEVGEGVAPELCLSLQELSAAGGSHHGRHGMVLSHAMSELIEELSLLRGSVSWSCGDQIEGKVFIDPMASFFTWQHNIWLQY
jgi:hypothetical protein